MSLLLKSVSGLVSMICLVFSCQLSSAQGSSGRQGSSSPCYHYISLLCPSPAPNQAKCSDYPCAEVITYEGGGSGGQPPTRVTKYFCRQSQIVQQINGSWWAAQQSFSGDPRKGNSTQPSNVITHCALTQACNNNQECGSSNLCSEVGSSSGTGTAHVDAVIVGQCPPL